MGVRPHDVRPFLSPRSDFEIASFCEPVLIKSLRASEVLSIDNSAFEGATYVHDMNLPTSIELTAKFDTIFDGGCLEHIFNAPQALQNVSRMCRKGGQILHALPANNFCGHGFWQFTPELFHSLYAEANGYSQTEVFIADVSRKDAWFKVAKPHDGRRINIHSSTPLYVLVRTVRAEDAFRHDSVQQSDYVHRWAQQGEAAKATTREPLTRRLRRSRAVAALRDWLPKPMGRPAKRWRAKASERLDDRNPGLTRTPIPSAPKRASGP